MIVLLYRLKFMITSDKDILIMIAHVTSLLLTQKCMLCAMGRSVIGILIIRGPHSKTPIQPTQIGLNHGALIDYCTYYDTRWNLPQKVTTTQTAQISTK